LIELTSRLTLSSCVSQLTDFYTTDIQEELLEYGFQETRIKMCDKSGEVIPYIITLEPLVTVEDNRRIHYLDVNVFYAPNGETGAGLHRILQARIEFEGRTIRSTYQCALHLAGDTIKFNEKGS